MKKTPKFSIITVCLNEEDTIQATCESIIFQTNNDFEWIVIDGQSTDGTLKVLDQFKRWITQLVSEPDDGIYDAMNKGILRSSGEYILFLNGGDCFTSNDVLEIVSQVKGPNLIFGDIIFSQQDGKNTIVNHPDVLPKNFMLTSTLPHQATFIRRSLFDQYGLYDTSFRIAGDYDWFVRAICVHKVEYLHIARIFSVFYEGGVSSHSIHRHIRDAEYQRVRRTYFSQILCWKRSAGLKLKSLRKNTRGFRRAVRQLIYREEG